MFALVINSQYVFFVVVVVALLMNLAGSHELFQTAACAWSLLSPSAQPHMMHFFNTHQPSKHLLCYAGPLFF